MKLPEYSLRKGITFRPPDSGPDDEIEFPSGTLVFVFWNETLLPDHIRKALDEVNRFSHNKRDGKTLMCMIGRFWIPIPESNIRSNR